jgi:hypothetical protein
MDRNFRYIYLTLGVMLTVGVTWAVWLHPDGLWSSIGAAWLQAIGSVGAIVVAGWAVWRQERQRTLDDQIERLRLRGDQLEALIALSSEAVDLVSGIRFTHDYFFETLVEDGFEQLEVAFAQIPAHEARDRSVAKAIMDLRRYVPRLKESLLNARSDTFHRKADEDGLYHFHDDTEASIRCAAAAIAEAHESLITRLDRINGKLARLAR